MNWILLRMWIPINNESDSTSSLDSPLYQGAPVTLYATLLLILAFSLSHKITKEALSDLFSLLNVQPHCLPTSVYQFYKILKLDKAATIRHHYCLSCNQLFENKSSLKCSNPSCGHILAKERELPYFLELSLEDQMKKLFERPSFYQQLQHRFSRNKSNNNIEGIYDGKLYKEHSKPYGIL